MAFVVAFTVKQSADGATVTLTDTTNYGDGGSFNKADFTSRTLYITRGDDLVENTVPFPFTNTNNSVQDIYSWSIDQDYVYSIKMVLIHSSTVEYTFTSGVITSEYTNKMIRSVLAGYSNCGCKSNCKLAMQMECGVEAATDRTCAGDISEAQQIMFYVGELYNNHVNC